MGKGIVNRLSRQSSGKIPNFPAVVPRELIEQTEAFTAPRGKLEMGGLLLGHVNQEGENVAVCGFFPQQTEANSGYCEFNGMYTAIAAAACDHANQSLKLEDVPLLRIIGWIHTHPDIGIFLSGIDVNTFRTLRDQCQERRLMAVVVDPLRKEHGVFVTEGNSSSYEQAKGVHNLSPELEARYHHLIDRLREVQATREEGFLPCIMPGHLRGVRNAMGDRDDIESEWKKGLFELKKNVNSLQSTIDVLKKDIYDGQAKNSKLEREITILQRANNILKDTSLNEIKKLQNVVSEIKNLHQNLREMDTRMQKMETTTEVLKNQLKDNSELIAKMEGEFPEKIFKSAQTVIERKLNEVGFDDALLQMKTNREKLVGLEKMQIEKYRSIEENLERLESKSTQMITLVPLKSPSRRKRRVRRRGTQTHRSSKERGN